MSTEQTFLALAVALFAGLLIGAERGWQQRDRREGERAAGIRTFGLLGLAGGLAGLLARQYGVLVLAAGLLVAGAFALTVYTLSRRHSGDVGMTTEVAAFVTFALGAVAIAGELAVAAAAAVVTAVLLGLKPRLHGWLASVSQLELAGALRLLLVSVVVLPVLPNRGYGPWDALNPFVLWSMVVLIAAIGFVGYVAVRLLGTRYGLLLTGAAAGLMASTPLALAFGRLGRQSPQNAGVLVAAILVASSTMFPRALILATAVAPDLLAALAGPLLFMMAAGYGCAGLAWRQQERDASAPQPPIRNPFELGPALRFGALLVVVTLAAHGLEAWVGQQGLYALAFVSGLTDVDAITLSLAGFVGERSGIDVIATGILIAAMANTVFKAGLVVAAGGRAMVGRMLLATIAILVAGSLAFGLGRLL